MLFFRNVAPDRDISNASDYGEEVLNAGWFQVCPELLPRLKETASPVRQTVRHSEDIDSLIQAIYRYQE